MGSTGSPNNLPWPEYNQEADGPKAFQDLATAVDTALKTMQKNLDDLGGRFTNGFNADRGDIGVGRVDSVEARRFINRRSVGGARYLTTYIGDGPRGIMALTLNYVPTRGAYPSGMLPGLSGASTYTNSVHLHANGEVSFQRGGDEHNFVPFAWVVDRFVVPAIPSTGNRYSSVVYSFPKGRFSQPPIVVVSSGDRDVHLACVAQSSASATIEARRVEGTTSHPGTTGSIFAFQGRLTSPTNKGQLY